MEPENKLFSSRLQLEMSINEGFFTCSDSFFFLLNFTLDYSAFNNFNCYFSVVLKWILVTSSVPNAIFWLLFCGFIIFSMFFLIRFVEVVTSQTEDLVTVSAAVDSDIRCYRNMRLDICWQRIFYVKSS